MSNVCGADFGLSMFSTDEQRARELYQAFIDQRLGAEISPLAEIHPRERRVLGDDRFLAKLSILVLRRSTATLEQVAAENSTNYVFRSNSCGPHFNLETYAPPARALHVQRCRPESAR